jgi:hypothetical protein
MFAFTRACIYARVSGGDIGLQECGLEDREPSFDRGRPSFE